MKYTFFDRILLYAKVNKMYLDSSESSYSDQGIVSMQESRVRFRTGHENLHSV
jgi:hypothetical protein